MPTEAAQPSAAVTPGTTATGRPAARSASTSSPPRPKMKGSPAFRRTTVSPARTRRTSSALISSCVQRAWPLRLPTATSSASRRARVQHCRRHQVVVHEDVGLAQQLRGLQRQQIGIAGARADDVGDAHGRQPAAGVIEFAKSGAAGAGIVAGQNQARRRSLDQPAPEGAAPGGIDDQRVDLGAEGRGQLRQVADALRQYRLDAAAQGGGERRRGAAGRDRHHDVVAVDDRRQDEIAESRPVGHVHRHAERLGDPLGDRVVLEVAGGNEDRGRATQVVDPDVRKLSHKGASRARQGGATIGGRPLAHHDDPAA